jgi:hypothetical protein
MHVCMFRGALFFQIKLCVCACVCIYLYVCVYRLICPSVSEWYRKNNIREEAFDRGVREEI